MQAVIGMKNMKIRDLESEKATALRLKFVPAQKIASTAVNRVSLLQNDNMLYRLIRVKFNGPAPPIYLPKAVGESNPVLLLFGEISTHFAQEFGRLSRDCSQQKHYLQQETQRIGMQSNLGRETVSRQQEIR
ncbi:hypothetical protein PFISCL1PPCAC_21055 [Pristionchus fissidentatus]|uniref:Uncharacterized protein n=1 Tax=Pristionchus fissidentatus TaxID=1538716 RepID=A0AAV5WHG0_9BILA|nr:hypothetical protein PFISCL1PPCAC_21055 [Pristionchus fissidentatus]